MGQNCREIVSEIAIMKDESRAAFNMFTKATCLNSNELLATCSTEELILSPMAERHRLWSMILVILWSDQKEGLLNDINRNTNFHFCLLLAIESPKKRIEMEVPKPWYALNDYWMVGRVLLIPQFRINTNAYYKRYKISSVLTGWFKWWVGAPVCDKNVGDSSFRFRK